MEEQFRYHVLLIGCDKYPPGQNSLHGCVNDIDAIEQLLFEAPGVGVPPANIDLTRLAAPHDNTPAVSRFHEQTIFPTRDNIITALQSLAEAHVQPTDQVLIYYSGHGGQMKRMAKQGWHECLVAADDKLLFDDELNPMIAAIAKRTSDVTIILDCCHSASATRAYIPEPAHGAIRMARIANTETQQPDSALGATVKNAAPLGQHLLQQTKPDYLAVVACQSDEKAQEDWFEGAGTHGLLTYALLQSVQSLNIEQRMQICWAHIWPVLLDKVLKNAEVVGQNAQHPWIIGRSARRVFGGSWAAHDPGFAIRHLDDQRFAIEAGTLVGFGISTMVGIYGPSPALFPEIGSDADRAAQLGTARITMTNRATCMATAITMPQLPLPAGTRVRIISPAEREGLRVYVDPAAPNPAETLQTSAMLELVEDRTTAELWVDKVADGWLLSNDLNVGLAKLSLQLPEEVAKHPGFIQSAHITLRAGLVSYARYNTVLRLAKRCNDPELDQAIQITLLDCNDSVQVTQANHKNPALPELPRDENGINVVSIEYPFCIRIRNNYFRTLYVTVLNCTAGGMVEHLGTMSVHSEDVETLWYKNFHQNPFYAKPDNRKIDTTDRIVAIVTTRQGTDLSNLETDQTIQDIFDNPLRSMPEPGYLPELWTASIRLLRLLGEQHP